MSLAEREGVAQGQQGRVGKNSVSVLVDHFWFDKTVASAINRTKNAKNSNSIEFAIDSIMPIKYSTQWEVNALNARIKAKWFLVYGS